MAGVVMWVGGGMVATIAALIVFWFWFAGMERDSPGGTVGLQVPVTGAPG